MFKPVHYRLLDAYYPAATLNVFTSQFDVEILVKIVLEFMMVREANFVKFRRINMVKA